MSNVKSVSANQFFVRGDQVYINSSVIGGKPFMLLVHANYCGHCRVFMPDYINLSKQTTRFNFLEIEAEEMKKNPQLPNALKIVGYPTILFGNTKGLVAEEFNGDRSIGSLANKIKSVCKYCI
jgi:thiol-disulfide isomerase/thioredoxin